MSSATTARTLPLTTLRRHSPAALLLAAYFALAVSGVREKSVTYDELAHLTAGYSYWLTDDYRLHPENGNLPQRWAALPLLVSRPAFPPLDQPPWQLSSVWVLGYEFFYEAGNDPDWLLFQGRVMIALLGVALGLLVYAWSGRLFGRAGGLVSLTLYAFCPTTLSHGALVTSDMAAALFFTASVGCLWVVLHRVTPAAVLASCLAVAGLFLTKMSAPMVVLMGALLVLLRLLSRQPLPVWFGRSRLVQSQGKQLLIFLGLMVLHAVVVAGAVWAALGFRYAAFREAEPGRDRLSADWEMLLKDTGRVGAAVEFARDHHLLPEAYLFGFQFVYQHAQGRNAFLNGEFSQRGWPQFFPYCLAAKTPLPTFAVLALAAAAAFARRRGAPAEGRLWDGFYRTAPLWVLLAVYWGFAIPSKLNIGHRHLLPTYPAMFILAGAAGYWLKCVPAAEAASGRRWPLLGGLAHPLAAVVTVFCLLLVAAESLRTWPHYLAYFNQWAGGPGDGYKHLVDSSLDWGQDLPGLKRWLDKNERSGEGAPRVYLAYFGMGSPEHYGIDAVPVVRYHPFSPHRAPVPLTGGVYCISATLLQAVYSPTPGPWSGRHEQAYQQYLALMHEYDQRRNDPKALDELMRMTGRSSWGDAFETFEQIRLARLCAFLRQREPDDQVGHSILIYRLSDADVEKALFGPAPTPRARF